MEKLNAILNKQMNNKKEENKEENRKIEQQKREEKASIVVPNTNKIYPKRNKPVNYEIQYEDKSVENPNI